VIPRNNRLQRTTDLTFRLFSDQFALGTGAVAGGVAGAGNADESSTYREQFEIFAGPKEAELLQEYGLRDLISFGWFAWVSRPLLGFLRFFYGVFGNYGIAIVLLTVFVRLIIFPISRRAQMNAARHAKIMQVMQPEIKKIQEKYKDNLERRARAQNELFKRYNYSPLSMFGGCLLMFLQLPIFIGLYRGLSVDIALRGQPLIPGLQWCSNLAGPDQLLYWEHWLPFGLGEEHGLLGRF
jgi:YidC/Oxa1 family membrane protein insertase